MNYTERLKYLELHSLKGRRIRGDLIQVFKIFKGLDDIKVEDIFCISNYGSTRNQGQKLMKHPCKTDIRKYSFSNRIVELWNSLPLDIKNAETVNTFKNRIDKNQKLIEKFYTFDEG